MIDYTITFVVNFSFLSITGALLYWLPACICAVGYVRKSVLEFCQDRRNRDSALRSGGPSFYTPSLTVGLILGRTLVAAFPGINIPVAIFQHLPTLLGRFFRWMGGLLDIPLVPK